MLYTRAASCGDIDADYVVLEGLRDRKVGYKIHIGPDPPPDADLVLTTPNEEAEIRCVKKEICEVLAQVSQYKPKNL